MIEFNNNSGIFIADFGVKYYVEDFNKLINFIKNSNDFIFDDIIDDFDTTYLVFKFKNNDFILSYDCLKGMYVYCKKKENSSIEDCVLIKEISLLFESILN